jgi:hypothetical protein
MKKKYFFFSSDNYLTLIGQMGYNQIYRTLIHPSEKGRELSFSPQQIISPINSVRATRINIASIVNHVLLQQKIYSEKQYILPG